MICHLKISVSAVGNYQAFKKQNNMKIIIRYSQISSLDIIVLRVRVRPPVQTITLTYTVQPSLHDRMMVSTARPRTVLPLLIIYRSPYLLNQNIGDSFYISMPAEMTPLLGHSFIQTNWVFNHVS